MGKLIFTAFFVSSLYLIAALAIGHGSIYCGHKTIIGEPVFKCYMIGKQQ